MINDATVLTPDIYGLNGVVHVIDTVLLQPCTLPASVVEIATTNEGFSTLVAAVTAANLVETLQGEGPFTVFAPTDAAFLAAIQALNTTAADLLASPDLGSILTYHVAAGKV